MINDVLIKLVDTAGLRKTNNDVESEGIMRAKAQALKADIVLIAREMLREPYFALHVAKKLNVDLEYFPKQYLRAK